jgi:hypothetical protein
VKDQGKVIVVFASDVVKLASVTVAVALASISVPVGFHHDKVSNLTDRLAVGDTYFLNASCIVLPATPLPNQYNATLVLSVTSPIFCTSVLSAKVGEVSANRLSFSSQSSPSM